MRRDLRFVLLGLATLAALHTAPVRLGADEPPRMPAEPRWLAGDMHVHVAPPDEDGHTALTVATAIRLARKSALDFIVLTPHDADRSFPTGDGGPPQSGQVVAARLVAEAMRAVPGEGIAPARPLLVVSGWEYTRDDPGHLGFAFFKMADVASAAAARKAEVAIAKGALVVVNHPFFRHVESDLPVMKLITDGRAWRPFLGESDGDVHWNAIEVWHERSVLVQRMHANTAAKFPGTQMVADAMRAWERATASQQRRIVAVGGSDCHGRLPYAIAPMAMMTVRVDSFGEEALREGLLAGHVTFGKDGGGAARDFTATSDVAGEKASIGDAIRARSEVRLAWSGKATLWENGEKAGAFDGGVVRKLEPAGAFAFWRIEKAGDAYSNMIYANLR